MTFSRRSFWPESAFFPNDIEHWFGKDYLPAHVRDSQVSFPAVNLEVSPESYDYYVFAPGLDKAQTDITLDKNLLTVTGESPVLIPDAEGVTVYRRERRTGKFSKSLKLAKDCSLNNISASYSLGVLHIKVQRLAHTSPEKITIT
ncbi:Hsp20/alpha crystallin family protein [Thalassomonas actiniarum]|uniref:Hsp20/alpha crystallin family protein n=1 Tax=Thalassomonas actiniarum TaxID=485447 RepID=A0AAF0BYZ3_9GAMM|nr:Hsp20/alpha crystallin family protein [Thalassomonas actiniarum]WDD97671.1 Hsp20/alpha crystallin family protein [Thalassomonas actiniarum]